MSDPGIPRSPRGPHPSPEALFSARRDPESDAGRAALDHAATCADCSEELVHAEAFLRKPGGGASKAAWERFRAGAGTSRAAAVPAWALALAAAAVLAIGLPLLLRRPAADVERGESSAATLVSPRGSVSEPPRTFAFRVPSGRTARVMVFDSDRTYEWTSSPSGGTVVFPDPERKRLKSGRDYFWTLVGTEGSAPVARFRIR
jgi:hypothetical protein